MKLLGGAVIAVTFIVYYILTGEGYDVKWISIYGMTIGTSLTFAGIGREEKNKRLKHLIYYPISFFFAVLTTSYVINGLTDILINVNKIVLTLSITISTCLLYYYFKKSA